MEMYVQNGVQASQLWDVRQRRGQQRMDRNMTRRERYEAAEVDVRSDKMNPLNEQQAYTQAPKKIPKKRCQMVRPCDEAGRTRITKIAMCGNTRECVYIGDVTIVGLREDDVITGQNGGRQYYRLYRRP